MRVYAVRILDTVFADIDEIAEFIVSVSSPEHAVRYVDELQAEILSLRYLAGIIPESRYQTVRQYHPCAKLPSLFHSTGRSLSTCLNMLLLLN